MFFLVLQVRLQIINGKSGCCIIGALLSGLLLPDGRARQVREDRPEAAPAVDPDDHVSGLAGGRRAGVRAPGRRLPVAEQGSSMHPSLLGHRHAQYAGKKSYK